MSITRYEAYKDSGVEWLGDVPTHWDVIRAKDTVIKIGNGVTPKGGSNVYLDTGIPFLRSQNVYDDGLKISKVSFISQEIHDGMKGSQLKSGDILINITGASIGRTCVVPMEFGDANINQHIAFLRTKFWFNSVYISIFLKSPFIKNYIQFEQNGASKEAFNLNQIANIPLVLPNCTEQQVIANYLDTQTAQIDRKIDLLSQKATQYGKLKQSLINETVTRGLDKTVPMKDSGVEWIGEVPAHWILNRHKDNFSCVAGRCTNSSLTKVGLENIEGKTGRFISTGTQFDGDGVEFKKNDILFGKLRPYLAKVYLSEFNGNAIGDIFVYRPTRNTKPKFALYLMLSDKYIDVINSSTAGAKMPRVSSNFIANLPVSIPSKQEQQTIATYLDDKTAHIDRIITTINTQINKLKELRKALINDVVTGKICVLSESAQEL
jgi:type I restriction enzyme S subunit